MNTIPEQPENTQTASGQEFHKKLEQAAKDIERYGVTDPHAYTSATLLQGTFPQSSRAGNELVLINGDMKITMWNSEGLPYGHYPRLIMIWITREALRRQGLPIDEARRIPIGKSFLRFMREVGIFPKDRRPSSKDYKRLREHLFRLAGTIISISVQSSDEKRKGRTWKNVPLTEEGTLWWDEDEQRLTEDSVIVLTEAFYLDLIHRAVPLDPLHIAKIARSPMAIDVYQWATYKISTHGGFTRVKWEQLQLQFGVSYQDTSQGRADFRRSMRKAIEQVREAWPEIGIREWSGGVELYGQKPAVEHRHIPNRKALSGNTPMF